MPEKMNSVIYMFLAKLLPRRLLSQQARRPSGFIGRFVMSNIFTKVNHDLNCFVEATLNLQPSNHVLEIGFGPGKLIKIGRASCRERV